MHMTATLEGLIRQTPANEPVLAYRPGSPELAALQAELRAVAAAPIEAGMRIGSADVRVAAPVPLHAPHDRRLHLANVHQAEPHHVHQAIAAARAAAPVWGATSFEERAAIFSRAAELLAGPRRARLNAATMLGQSKSVHQAEIDAACELVDFWRFNVHFAAQIHQLQPISTAAARNRLDYRPLDGFVLAITPFNFTAIAGNLPSAPALMGNTIVWKPSVMQALSAHHTLELLLEAGLPPGVINLVHGDGALVAEIATADPGFAGLHFTGSGEVFSGLWRQIAQHLTAASTYPRLVGETGGKDFVLAHASADVDALVVALARGAFEYQGQKCSAASRAYVPRSLWPTVRSRLASVAGEIPMGDVADPRTFMGAVITEKALERHVQAIAGARARGDEILTGGQADTTVGWFVQPTVIVTNDPRSDTMVRELFGPILTVYVYDDRRWADVLELIPGSTPYALTGSVFADEPAVVAEALGALRAAAGNFYVNDKPTGAVVGQQPFGGSRASGTNDKAGSLFNLMRWTSPRTVKEQLEPIREWRYPHQGIG
jgi:1-pyrroline-5-carboxylate dehydrogenase